MYAILTIPGLSAQYTRMFAQHVGQVFGCVVFHSFERISTMSTTGLSEKTEPGRRQDEVEGVVLGGSRKMPAFEWDVILKDGEHKIKLEHGYISGKRVITIDGKEVLHKNWLLQMDGKELFSMCGFPCSITISVIPHCMYETMEYTLEINGKTHKKFLEQQKKNLRIWQWDEGTRRFRVVQEKDTLDVWVNGEKVETTGEFVEDGVKTWFAVEDIPAYIGTSTGSKKSGVIHSLYVNDVKIPL